MTEIPSFEPRRSYELAFSRLWPVLAGALAGLVLRGLFSGKVDEPYATMMASFVLLAPVIVGCVTVYAAERWRARHWSYWLLAPMGANVLFVLGTLVLNFEGIICVFVIVPMFAILGALGGLIMGAICRLLRRSGRVLYAIGALPLLLGFIEARLPLPQDIESLQRTQVIAAAPERVWQEIHQARNIQPEEVAHGLMYRIGVPMPLAGITEQTPDGPVRRITMGKGIQFDQVATVWQPPTHVTWRYRFEEDSVPAGALDDHVRIGGAYFDLLSTAYTLTPVDRGTELRIDMSYRVSTHFNWYARPLARLLVGNFEKVILDFYRRRSELPQT